jgi:hypothetical protein
VFFIRLLGILAVLATLCFGAQITLQVLEMKGYEAPPSVWPPK